MTVVVLLLLVLPSVSPCKTPHTALTASREFQPFAGCTVQGTLLHMLVYNCPESESTTSHECWSGQRVAKDMGLRILQKRKEEVRSDPDTTATVTNINSPTLTEVTPLYLACRFHSDTDTIRFLLLTGANPNSLARWTVIHGRHAGETRYDSPLYQAARDGHVAVVRDLLDSGANPNIGHYSPLEAASTNQPIKEMLLAAGAKKWLYGWTCEEWMASEWAPKDEGSTGC
jgi:hypothetical protein